MAKEIRITWIKGEATAPDTKAEHMLWTVHFEVTNTEERAYKLSGDLTWEGLPFVNAITTYIKTYILK